MALAGAAGRERGTNRARVKDYNQVVVLDLIRSSGPIARPAIAAATGLTLQTVSNIVTRLRAAGAVIEEEVTGSGRSRRALRLNPDAAFALGLHLVRTHLAVGVVDLAGRIRGSADREFALDEPPDCVLEHLNELVERATIAAGIGRDRILGAGIGAPGPLDLRRGTLLNVLSPASWSYFPMRAAVADALGMRVIMDNDATAAALGEHWSGVGARCHSFVYIYLGTGTGAGFILDGEAYRGVRGNAGEISHIQVDPAGAPCECRNRGCLGRYVTAEGLFREARRAALEAPCTDPLPALPETVAELARSEEPRLAAVVRRAGEHLARVVTELGRALDPELIVLGGPLAAEIGDPLRDAVVAGLADLEQPGAPAPSVELSLNGSDAGVIGAATLVLHDVYAPTTHKLSLAEPSRGPDAEQQAA